MNRSSCFTVKIIGGLVVLVLLGASAQAQSVPPAPDPTEARVRLGPVYLNPGIGLTNAGLDSNVYLEADSQVPETDLTMTVTPQSDLFMRVGRTWLMGNIREDLVWYKEFASERSVNQFYTARWLVPLNRLRFAINGNWIAARDRPGYEIDARSQRYESAVAGAVEVRALAKTFFVARGERRDIEYDKDAVFLGTNLNDELTRTEGVIGLGVRHQLTPLTSITLDGERTQDRFKFSPERDSDSSQLSVGLSFAPFALISGTGQVGYRDFKPLAGDVPGFTGFTAKIDLTYVALGSTRIGFRALRDIEYSFDINQPYYLQTGFNVSVGQQVYGPMDVEGRVGNQQLAYRVRGTNADGRVDRVRSFGGGIGYRLGVDLRMGFNIDRQERTSDLIGHDYDDLRFGFAVTYGLTR